MRHSIGGIEDNEEATVPSRDDGDEEMNMFHASSTCRHLSEPTSLNELLWKLSIRHERSSLKSRNAFPSPSLSLADALTRKPASKTVRFATNSQTSQVWALSKEFEPIPPSLKKEVWWTKQELEDLYDTELEETLVEVEASYKNALRTAYLSCKDPSTTENTVALCFAHMLDCQQARGLETEVLPQLKHYKKKHRCAVLNACRTSRRKLEEETITAKEWSFCSDNSESEDGGDGEASLDSHEERTIPETSFEVYNEYCWNEICQESLKFSKPCRWVARKMGEYDHCAATTVEESSENRRISDRWTTDEISEYSFSSDQDILSEALELVHHHQPHQHQNCARPKRSSSIDEGASPPVPSAVSLSLPEGSAPIASEPSKNEDDHDTSQDYNTRREKSDRSLSKPKTLRHDLQRRDSADLLQAEDRRSLLRQDSSARLQSSFRDEQARKDTNDTPLKVPQRLLSPEKQRQGKKKLPAGSCSEKDSSSLDRLPTLAL